MQKPVIRGSQQDQIQTTATEASLRLEISVFLLMFSVLLKKLVLIFLLETREMQKRLGL